MPARIIEELTSRKKEKIATFLTFESIVAVIIGFMPIFMISSSWPLLTRVPLCLAGAVAGYIVTLELHGLPLYEHVLWTARGLFRLRVHGNRVVPEDLPGAIPAPDEDRVIALSGPIELVQRRGGRRLPGSLLLPDGKPERTVAAATSEPLLQDESDGALTVSRGT
jgi:hypothetical protein